MKVNGVHKLFDYRHYSKYLPLMNKSLKASFWRWTPLKVIPVSKSVSNVYSVRCQSDSNH